MLSIHQGTNEKIQWLKSAWDIVLTILIQHPSNTWRKLEKEKGKKRKEEKEK